ncbi:hypothetical protein ACIGHN_10880 [Acidovorax sp. NPDC077693]|uniref:hypothetical protein n=1 Tax=unclassified Acidovorax TaxID=2684926 RepID=UPI0037CA7D01
MRTYCSLVISSDTDAQLAATVLRILGLRSSEVVDTQTPDLIFRREKIAKILGKPPLCPPRYIWRFSSKNIIHDKDIQAHIAWLLSQVRLGRSIREVTENGGNAFLTCFWAGNGRGGGPILPSSLMRAVADHGVELQFDFYVEENNESACED